MQIALLPIMHTELQKASPSSTVCEPLARSQTMSQFTDNLDARRRELRMEIDDVVAAMNRRGFPVVYSTVAGWLNGNRGERWKVEELQGLLSVLKTDLAAMAGHARLVEAPLIAVAAGEMERLTPAQQQAILATIKAMADANQGS